MFQTFQTFNVLIFLNIGKKDRDRENKEQKDNGSRGPSSMSVSVPNLTSATNSNTMEQSNPAGLLETFAAMARRRTSAGSSGGTNNGSAGINNPSPSNNIPSTPSPGNTLFPRAPSSVTSLVRLALSSNFPGGFIT